jgi:hypothetical protein
MAVFGDISENWLEWDTEPNQTHIHKIEIILKYCTVPGTVPLPEERKRNTFWKDKKLKYLTSTVQAFGEEKRVAKIIV